MFDCEIQARYRDVNLGGHVDNVEAIRLVDEARIQFLRFSPLSADEDAAPGLLAALPSGVVELADLGEPDRRLVVQRRHRGARRARP